MYSQESQKIPQHNEPIKFSARERLRIWLLEHPKLNPLRFSFRPYSDPEWHQHPNDFSIGRGFRMLTSSIRMLPDFIVIGSSKSGSWSIHNYLLQHPSVGYSARNLQFYVHVYSDKINWYKSHFPTKIHKSFAEFINKRKFLAGEHSSMYIHHPLIPQRTKETVPNVKLIVTLRNPVARAYSNYHHMVRVGYERRTFEEAVFSEMRRMEIIKENESIRTSDPNFASQVLFNYLRHAIYVDNLEKWFRFFPREQFCIIENGNLSKNPQSVMDEIFKFLNLPSFKLKQEERWNVGKYEKMKESTRKTLLDFFKPYNERLYKLLGCNFNWD